MKKILIINLFILYVLSFSNVNAEDFKKIFSLSGYWKFSIGDDMSWSSPSYDDSGWDQIKVPSKWEDEGYSDYNGYAWYRKTFKLEAFPNGEQLILMIGRIDDIDEVYLNGKLIGRSGEFPPYYKSAYDKNRRYNIPSSLIRAGSENTIAIRVYDSYLEGGIINGPFGIFISADNEFMDINLSGKWKFHKGQNGDWKAANFDDSKWKDIAVPSEWEQEGYYDYDGYAFYRKKFKFPENFNTQDIYLSLGKIDDEDDVYFNGVKIGSVFDLNKDGEYKHRGYEYNARRVYKIPSNVLSKNGVNVISIRVYDGQLRGGIYEGPIGIMSKENYRKYMNKYHSNQSFWDYIYDQFID